MYTGPKYNRVNGENDTSTIESLDRRRNDKNNLQWISAHCVFLPAKEWICMTKKQRFHSEFTKRAHPNVFFWAKRFSSWSNNSQHTTIQEGGSRNKVAGVGWLKDYLEFISETFQRISKYFFVRDSLSWGGDGKTERGATPLNISAKETEKVRSRKKRHGKDSIYDATNKIMVLQSKEIKVNYTGLSTLLANITT